MQALIDPSNYAFSGYSIPLLVFAPLMVAFGLLTVWRERASFVSVLFLAMSLPTAVWLFAFAAVYSTTDPSLALTFSKASHLGVCFIPITVFWFSAAVTGKLHNCRWLICAGLAFASGLYVMDVSTDWIIKDVEHYYFGYYPIFSLKASWALLAYFAASFGATLHLYRVAYATTQSVAQRGRLKAMMVGLAIAHLGTIDFLPDFHVPIYPFGYVFIAAFNAIGAWAIARYRLVDITPALAAQQVINTMAEGLLIVDRDGIVRVANDAAASVWGLESSAIGSAAATLDSRWGQDGLMRLIDPASEHDAEVTYHARDGSLRTVVLASSKLIDHQAVWVGTVFIIHDITARWRAELALRESEERFRSLVQNASDLITVVDPDTTIRYQSPAIRRVLGYDAEAAVGQKLSDIVHPDDRGRFVAALGEIMTKPDSAIAGEGRIQDSAGVWRHLEFLGTDQRANLSIGGIVLNVRDVSERKQLEDQLRHQALHDPLTKLANRTRFADRLEHALVRRRRSGESVAVMFMDLDNFKGINDSLGHAAGDALLMQVAERAKACLRPEDTIARLGGDEFAILLEGISAGDDATAVAERIFQALERPFSLGGKDIAARASIGIATSDGNEGYDADGLLRDADIAMYVAKSQGKGCCRVFEPTMQSSMMERLELIAELPRAVERGELRLHYQPIFWLRSGKLFGVESLVRWQHPRCGLVQPNDFIPLAEETGAILGIGTWVLQEACRQAATWQSQFGSEMHWTISLNVSVKQLQSATFVEEIEGVLQASGLERARLILEITESVMMQDAASMLKRLHELKALGIGLAIDDFGTGYSSLNYLRQFPFDLLKIDKAFIDDLGTTVNRKELTRAIVELGKTLDLELVAEGIEREEQLTRLVSLECELGQGFYFAEPLEAFAVEQLLTALAAESVAA